MDFLKLLFSALIGKAPEKSERQKLPIPEGAVLANEEALIDHVHSFDLPLYYLDRKFICTDCGSNELWKAEQQKWWYEEAKGHIDSTAIRCRDCRNKLKDQKQSKKTIC